MSLARTSGSVPVKFGLPILCKTCIPVFGANNERFQSCEAERGWACPLCHTVSQADDHPKEEPPLRLIAVPSCRHAICVACFRRVFFDPPRLVPKCKTRRTYTWPTVTMIFSKQIGYGVSSDSDDSEQYAGSWGEFDEDYSDTDSEDEAVYLGHGDTGIRLLQRARCHPHLLCKAVRNKDMIELKRVLALRPDASFLSWIDNHSPPFRVL